VRKAIQGTGTFIAAYGVRMSVVRQIMGHVGDVARRLACREAMYLQKRIESACPSFKSVGHEHTYRLQKSRIWLSRVLRKSEC